jgi:hypothetical protein
LCRWSFFTERARAMTAIRIRDYELSRACTMIFGHLSQDGERMAGKVGAPLVIDLGRIEREDIDQLGSGSGTILDDVDTGMAFVRQRIDLGDGERVFLPMVVVYTREGDARPVSGRLVVKVRPGKN